MADSSAFPTVPCTPMATVSRIPQRQVNAAPTSPLSGKLRGGNSTNPLGDLPLGTMNRGAPKMQQYQAMPKKPAATRGVSTTIASTRALDVNDKRGVSNNTKLAAGLSRKSSTSSSVSGTTTFNGGHTIRSKSATSMRPRQLGSRPGSAQDDVSSSRIMPVSVDAINAPWDVKGRLDGMERSYDMLLTRLNETSEELNAKVAALETERRGSELQLRQMEMANMELQQELRKAKSDMDDDQRRARIEMEDLERKYRNELDEQRRLARIKEEDLHHEQRMKSEELKTTSQKTLEERDVMHSKAVEALQASFESEKSVLQTQLETQEQQLREKYEAEAVSLREELQILATRLESERATATFEVSKRDEELKTTRALVASTEEQLQRQQQITGDLETRLRQQAESTLSMETTKASLFAKINELENVVMNKDSRIRDMEKQLADATDAAALAKEKLIKEETLRRVLHNQVQELRGNIRVFCRVRPPSAKESLDVADIHYPDKDRECSAIELIGPSNESALGTAMGTVSTKTHSFGFDRVFSPAATNADVFDEISQLVQSALDGYNVCIFCYGQTGSGKTFTMSSDDGMIRRAVDQIFSTAEGLQDRGWTYKLEGQFLEIYNETIYDLLVESDEFDKKKLDIRQDIKEGKISVPGLSSLRLQSRTDVADVLRRAAKNRTVAATKANERSSRSHSVFILSLHGTNESTGEERHGTLNLIDLAGSERLAHSQSKDERLRETVAINKSLSALREVITAIGTKDRTHIPYRNSKLTYLLQYSLGGNSKTLMFVNISPVKQHIPETVNSLRFATVVNNTHIGPAKKK
ncbi:kinesin-LIKE protein [Myxozyma melibiosi]|uniref:Kinesin-like protein n=1 Tax=Myxozyma melibiosi TaxID=54550 RepID=A0ABR1F1T2_9ASCO